MEKIKVAIIGAGASGLSAIKCCLDEGIIPHCFESTDDIGGLWNYQPERKSADFGTVMKSTVINTSKEMMCYSDFPIPKDYPIFMHNTKVQQYFQLYANQFGLKKFIRFNTSVVKVAEAESGKWSVKYKSLSKNDTAEEIFDGVLVCTGHHAMKHMPKFPGEERFKGKKVHSHDYTDHHGYEDKRVVVIGIGNSGGDIAVELSKISKQVYLSTRSGSWILNRVSLRGDPLDMVYTTRVFVGITQLFPHQFMASLFERDLTKKFDHARYCLKPKHRATSQHPMVNDDLPNRLISGTVIVKSNIKEITETGVEFDDGTVEDDVDAIIYATGYEFGFPFLDHPEFEVIGNRLNLYKYMFPTTVNNLAVIGYVQPLGAIMPISELQCRLATRVFKGLTKLPCELEMKEDIARKQKTMADQYTARPKHTLQVDWIPFMDELAELVGCKPQIGSLLLTDIRLGKEVLFGPCTPYQYRLHGPGAWSGARETILTQWERTYSALMTRPVEAMQTNRSVGFLVFICILILAFLVKVLL